MSSSNPFNAQVLTGFGRSAQSNPAVKQFPTDNFGIYTQVFTLTRTPVGASFALTPYNLKMLGSVTIEGNLTVNGTIFGTLATPSDAKLKENIELITENKADKILSLNPVSYNYISSVNINNKDNKDNNDNNHNNHNNHIKNKSLKINYGFIAQDLEKVYPDLVCETTKDNETYKTVDYLGLIPLMLTKMKKMQNEIDELKETINALKDQKT